jgi:large subunit ribosomal protein L17
MRHQKAINHLGRTSTHRKAMLANMACSLIKHKRITTTVAKAKALRSYVEPLITKSKSDSTHSRRMVFSYLQDKETVTELFREVAVKIAARPGGYTRILKTGFRLGDNADMCIIELVDYNTSMIATKEATAKKTATRRRRGTGSTKKVETAETPVAEKPAKAKPLKEVKEEKLEEVKEVVDEVKEVETPETPEAPENDKVEDAG